MMYYMLLVIALAGCAHAADPEYLNAYSNYGVSVNELKPHLNFAEPNQQQVNYMVLKVVVSLLADAKIYLNLEPEVLYALVTKLAAGLTPSLAKIVRDVANDRVKRAEERTAKLRKLIQKLCLGSRTAAGGAVCNAEVDREVKKDKELQKEARVLFALSDACSAYHQLEQELNNAAKSGQSVQEYFKTAKQKLLHLVRLTVNLYRLTDLGL